jgi:hypothetical protein
MKENERENTKMTIKKNNGHNTNVSSGNSPVARNNLHKAIKDNASNSKMAIFDFEIDQAFIEEINADSFYPVHTTHPGIYKKRFKNVVGVIEGRTYSLADKVYQE